MSNKLACARTEAGFTLIEVVVAMVILAVGMLSLEALGITAARQVNYANATSEHVVLVSHHLEEALDIVGRNQVLGCTEVSWEYGTPPNSVRVRRSASFAAPSLTIRVTAESMGSQKLKADAYTIAHQVFIPNASGYVPC